MRSEKRRNRPRWAEKRVRPQNQPALKEGWGRSKAAARKEECALAERQQEQMATGKGELRGENRCAVCNCLTHAEIGCNCWEETVPCSC